MSASHFLSTPGWIRRTTHSLGTIAWRLGIVLILIVSMVGMQPVSAAPAGTALQFDGANDYVTFGTASSLGAQVFTIETWLKRTGAGVTTSTGTGGLSAAVPLVAKGRGEAENSNVDMNYFFGIDTT